MSCHGRIAIHFDTHLTKLAHHQIAGCRILAPWASEGPQKQVHAVMTAPQQRFQRLERLAPLGYFAMGVGLVRIGTSERMLALANGSDWTPQPLTLHRPHAERGFEKLPSWFSNDYDHHMGLAVGDLSGNGYDDVVVAVFAGKNQQLSEGGLKVYRGGPDGLDPTPVWLAKGFAATGVALAPFGGKNLPDIVVSCVSEDGTIQEPGLDAAGRLPGRPRLLINRTRPGDENLCFETRIIESEIVRGAGDVIIADVDLDGTLDVVFAAPRTAVLFGDPGESALPWEHADTWVSHEEHPFSFSVQTLCHPDFPTSQLIASSRGLLSGAQLAGRTLEELAPGILVHAPKRSGTSHNLQHLAPLDSKRPELPAGLAVAYDGGGRPYLVAGFLDARGRDIRGAPLRIYRSTAAPTEAQAGFLFDPTPDEELPGGGLMAGRVCVAPRIEGPTTIFQHSTEVEDSPLHVVTLPLCPAGELLFVEAADAAGQPLDVAYCRLAQSASLCFSPPLPVGSRLLVAFRAADEVDIVAASSAAWPPAGASGIWRGRLGRRGFLPATASSSNTSVRQAG